MFSREHSLVDALAAAAGGGDELESEESDDVDNDDDAEDDATKKKNNVWARFIDVTVEIAADAVEGFVRLLCQTANICCMHDQVKRNCRTTFIDSYTLCCCPCHRD